MLINFASYYNFQLFLLQKRLIFSNIICMTFYSLHLFLEVNVHKDASRNISLPCEGGSCIDDFGQAMHAGVVGKILQNIFYRHDEA